MTAAHFIDSLGGTGAVANILGIKAPSVSAWRDGRSVLRIPDDKLIRLAPLAEIRGVATRKDLRPNDWQLIWPELTPKRKEVAHG